MNGGNPVRPRRGELNIRQLFVREQHLPALDVIAFIDLHVRIEIDIIRPQHSHVTDGSRLLYQRLVYPPADRQIETFSDADQRKNR